MEILNKNVSLYQNKILPTTIELLKWLPRKKLIW
jgi:hypothetical protein